MSYVEARLKMIKRASESILNPVKTLNLMKILLKEQVMLIPIVCRELMVSKMEETTPTSKARI